MKLTVIGLLLHVISLSCGQNADEIQKLKKVLFADYDATIRPPYDRSQTLNVNSTFSLRGMSAFNDEVGVLSSMAFLEMTWEDDRLGWDTSEYSNITEIEVPRSYVWMPQVGILNSVEITESLQQEFKTVEIDYMGYVTYTFTGNVRVACIADNTFFPFDSNICEILIGLWNNIGGNINLNAFQNSVDMEYTWNSASAWNLLSTKVYKVENATDIQVDIELRRKGTNIFFGTIFPIIILMFLNVLVFRCPIESGERISFSITMILSIMVFMSIMQDKMPVSSESFSLVSLYMFFDLLISAGILALTIEIVRKFANSPVKDEALKNKIKSIDSIYLGVFSTVIGVLAFLCYFTLYVGLLFNL